MHRDSKLKRAELKRLLMDQKYAGAGYKSNPKALEKFKQVPYQLIYQKKFVEHNKKEVE